MHNNNKKLVDFLFHQKGIKITHHSFEGSELTEFNIPSTVVSIGRGSFLLSQMRNITFESPSSCTKIGSFAFAGCNFLTHITIPSSVTSIRSYAFHECKLLKEIQLPSSITEIDDYTFESCQSLENIIIPASVNTIGYYAFSFSWRMQSLNLKVLQTILFLINQNSISNL